MIISENVYILCNNSNLKRYKSLGYKAVTGELLCVKIDDLPRYSRAKVKLKCDYCGAEYETSYYAYMSHRKIIQKDCCKNSDCVNQKRKESVSKTYGVEYISQTDEFKEKVLNTNINKYGVPCSLQAQEIRAKTNKTMMEKYGYEHPMQSEEIKDKIKETCMQRYGVENPLLDKNIMLKARETTFEKYGVMYAMQNPEIRNKALETKSCKYNVNGVMCSSQQEYLCSLYGGNLNTPMFGYLADITFNDSNIYIEYSGSGHNIRVLYGKMTQEEFDKHEEIRRSVFLQNGYKEFEIISKTDKLPDDEFLVRLKDKVFDILTNTDFVYFGYNIDTNEESYK